MILMGVREHQAPTTHTIGSGKPGPIALRMIEAFGQAVSGRNPRYEKWLTYVGK